MKSITIAVIFAGLVSYGSTYTPQAESHSPIFSQLATDFPPLTSEPDDDEEDRIATPKNRRKSV